MKKALVIATILLCGLIHLFFAESHAAMTWEKELVDYSGMIDVNYTPLKKIALAFYPNDTPVIGFFYQPDMHLVVKVKTALGWENIEVNESLTGIIESSLAIDSNGNLHFVLGKRDDSGYHRLIYALYDGNSWILEDVDTSEGSSYLGYPWEDINIVVDSNNTPRICHFSYNDPEWNMVLSCKSKETGGWLQSLQTKTHYSFLSLSTGLDAFDFLHVLYRDADDWHDHLVYRYETTEGWQGGFPVPGISKAWESKMILDSKNYPHVLYQDSNTEQYILKHKYQDETGWHEEIIETQPSGLYLYSLAIDFNDNLHIAYIIWTSDTWEESTSKLMYGYTNNGVWSFSEIDFCRMKGQYEIYASLAVDSQNVPHIAYVIPHFIPGLLPGYPSYDGRNSFFDKLIYASLTSEEHEATKEHRLQIKKAKKNKGNGIVTSRDGNIICGYTCAYGYNKDIPVTLSATANEGSTFLGWKPDNLNCTGTDPCTLTMDKAKAVQAVFVGDYTLKVVNQSKNGGTGTVISIPIGINCTTGSKEGCTTTYPYAEQVVLSASPDSGSTFLGWAPTKLCSGTGVCIVPMDKKRSVKAIFSGQ